MIFQTQKKYDQALLSTLLYIETDLAGDLSLVALAQRAGFSPYHFHRIFRKAIGESVKEHIRHQQLEKAAYRLKISQERVLRIALDAGFKRHEMSCATRSWMPSAGARFRKPCTVANAPSQSLSSQRALHLKN